MPGDDALMGRLRPGTVRRVENNDATRWHHERIVPEKVCVQLSGSSKDLYKYCGNSTLKRTTFGNFRAPEAIVCVFPSCSISCTHAL